MPHRYTDTTRDTAGYAAPPPGGPPSCGTSAASPDPGRWTGLRPDADVVVPLGH